MFCQNKHRSLLCCGQEHILRLLSQQTAISKSSVHATAEFASLVIIQVYSDANTPRRRLLREYGYITGYVKQGVVVRSIRC